MDFSFKTIAAFSGDVVLKEKGSKFISYVVPVAHEEEVRAGLLKIRKLHPKATHHCYAYRLGLKGEDYRANDNGEPSGTAGLPIYNQLLAHDLTNVLVVVVRYYGGTKLGVAGLIRAYKESAIMVLDQCEIVTRELHKKLTLRFDYENQSSVYQIIHRNGYEIQKVENGEQVTLCLNIRQMVYQSAVAAFADLKGIEIL